MSGKCPLHQVPPAPRSILSEPVQIQLYIVYRLFSIKHEMYMHLTQAENNLKL